MISMRKFKTLPPLKRLQEELDYNGDTGQFHWRRQSRSKGARPLDRPAGTVLSNGYIHITIQNCVFLAHRLAWKMYYGTDPPSEIDHVNGIRSDNRIDNLRLASRAEQSANRHRLPNNKSGYKGVMWDKQRSKWKAVIRHHGKQHNLGRFNTAEEAASAYQAAAERFQSSFAVHLSRASQPSPQD